MAAPVEIRWQVSAQVAEIKRVISEANAVFEQLMLHPRDRFSLNLLLWEALSNAIVHGCVGQPPSATIACRMQSRAGPASPEMIIEVSDPGPGFNWRYIMAQENAPPCQDFQPGESLPETGRGLVIFLKYATWFEFNAAGNQITLCRDLEKGSYLNE